MDARRWLGLQPTHNPMRWYLPVTPAICSRLGTLFGGCALGAAIEILERVSGRPTIWASAQYLGHTRPPSVVDLDVTLANEGRTTTQARVLGQVGGTEIFTVNASLGRRDGAEAGQWAVRPEVPPPEECPGREGRRDPEATITTRFEQRVASDDPRAGRSAIWTRMPDLLEVSAASLAIPGDFVARAIRRTLGDHLTATSLDNTLRVGRMVPTEWILVDIRVVGVANGFGHGHVHLWSDEGTLLATASQSVMLRPQPAPVED